MSGLVFDEETARRIEAMYLTRDAARRRGLVRAALAAAPGERVLDAGCGPGFYCAEIAAEVGPSGSVVGIDSSAPMLALAEGRCAGHANVQLKAGELGALPVDEGGFDAAICVQVLEYLPDVRAALADLGRALRPGGRIVVWDVDWATISIHAEDAGLRDRVLRAWDRHLVHPSLPRTLATDLRSAGFAGVAMEGHAFTALEFDTQLYGVALLPTMAAFVAGHDGITEAQAQAFVDEQRRLGERGELYSTITQLCFTATKEAS
jgi:arsenite methyltransferase